MVSLDNIILTGFSGTGKTCVGTEVARILGWEFFDTDTEVARRAGKSIPAIFKEDGEGAFRKLEQQVLKEACLGTKRLIVSGGGILMDPENRELVHSRGLVVGLEARPETIYQRLMGQDRGENPAERPLLAGPNPLEHIRDLKNRRQSFYAMSHWTVHTDNLAEAQVASEVIRVCQLFQGRLTSVNSEDLEVVDVVTHSDGSYPVRVGWGLLDHLGERISQQGIRGPAYIVSDSTVFPLYGRQVQRSFQRHNIEAYCFVIPPGEESKTLIMAQAIYEWLVHRRAERGHAIVAVGGGVVGDLAGFVAATFLRGMPLIQAPTSLTAMVDASIGGKVAVNLPQAKNLVGAFYPPQMVLADPQVLTTLGKRELAEGWTEAIKHGFILDADLVTVFEAFAEDLMRLEREVSTQVIRRSMAIKARIVAQDERETTGLRTILNYGHTLGHALEAATAYGRYLHGEAVSIGMMGAAYLSQRLGMIDEALVGRQKQLLKRFNLPVKATNVDIDGLFEALAMDKKTEGGSVKWVLLEDVGRAVVRSDVPTELVKEVVCHLLEEG